MYFMSNIQIYLTQLFLDSQNHIYIIHTLLMSYNLLSINTIYER